MMIKNKIRDNKLLINLKLKLMNKQKVLTEITCIMTIMNSNKQTII